MKTSLQASYSVVNDRIAPVLSVLLAKELELSSTHLKGLVAPNSELQFQFHRGVTGRKTELLAMSVLSWELPDYLGEEVRQWIRKSNKEFWELTLSKHICYEILISTCSDRFFYGIVLPEIERQAKLLRFRTIIPPKARRKVRRRGYKNSTKLSLKCSTAYREEEQKDFSLRDLQNEIEQKRESSERQLSELERFAHHNWCRKFLLIS